MATAVKARTLNRDFTDEIFRALDLLTGHYNRGNWRDVARVAAEISRTAKIAEREAEWDTRVSLTPAAMEIVQQELTEATEQ